MDQDREADPDVVDPDPTLEKHPDPTGSATLVKSTV